MLRRVDIVGNPNVGVFILATDDLAIVPYTLLDEKADIIKETLDVDVVKSSISGSSLIGSLAVANSKGIVVSPHVLDREIEQFEKLGLNVATLPGQYTAVGNIIAANDTGAIVSPFLGSEAIQVVEETLDVNVESTSMVGSDIIGSLITVIGVTLVLGSLIAIIVITSVFKIATVFVRAILRTAWAKQCLTRGKAERYNEKNGYQTKKCSDFFHFHSPLK